MSELIVKELGYGANAVDYHEAWDLQRRIHAEVVAGGPDTLLLLEHPPVFTAGKRTQPDERPLDPGGIPVVDVDRGGKITYHGPGQLVGYPIVRLPDHVYVVDHVRRIEEALIRACAELGVSTARVPGRSGVWLAEDERGPERKVAALGIRVSRGVAMHGFALNCDMDLSVFDRFVPCGISDAGVTSLSAEAGRPVSVAEAARVVEPHLRDLLSWTTYTRSPDLPAKPEPGRVPAGSTTEPRPTTKARLIDPAATFH
ncbi:MAG TPA: lipoyl(octanoyl) transferase LipB [Nocardioidaceae bacterium]|nr:lipoyl(octanoyl) transferase LipB [Nocardioidaceae bacterium]